MRKIISILVALGLVLGLTVMAAPVAAQDDCDATVAITPATACEGAVSTYAITFDSPVTLLAGNDMLSFDFGAGTTFAFADDDDIDVGSFFVLDEDIEVTGTHVEFLIPVGGGIDAGDTVTVTIRTVTNPAAGDYVMDLDYELVCCGPVVFDCAEYTINPAVTTYGLVWDSSPTYPGLAKGFIPPFRACGQEDFPGMEIDGKWANAFNLTLEPTLVGCQSPCPAANVTVTVTLMAAPAGSNVTLSFNGTVYNFVPTALDPEPDEVVGNWSLGNNTTLVWENFIHFDIVGDYEICVEVVCPAGTPTCPECESGAVTVAEDCYPIKVYQWKDAIKIDLYRKWNLISLPLVPLVPDQPIADQLAALPNADTLIKGVYHYDRGAPDCNGDWLVYGNGQTSLTTMVDGVSYWVKVDYSLSDPTKAPGSAVGGLWVWGTPKPVPPDSPSAYPVCEGWNMVGITGYDWANCVFDEDYLWNWWDVSGTYAQYGAIYGWDPANLLYGTQVWYSMLPGGWCLPWLQDGEGYWIAFSHDGMIYPP